jgi:hypothetical protein
MKLMLCALFNYNMGGKIKRLSMNVAFKYIWPKGYPWKDFLSVNNVSIFT